MIEGIVEKSIAKGSIRVVFPEKLRGDRDSCGSVLTRGSDIHSGKPPIGRPEENRRHDLVAHRTEVEILHDPDDGALELSETNALPERMVQTHFFDGRFIHHESGRIRHGAGESLALEELDFEKGEKILVYHLLAGIKDLIGRPPLPIHIPAGSRQNQ